MSVEQVPHLSQRHCRGCHIQDKGVPITGRSCKCPGISPNGGLQLETNEIIIENTFSPQDCDGGKIGS